MAPSESQGQQAGTSGDVVPGASARSPLLIRWWRKVLLRSYVLYGTIAIVWAVFIVTTPLIGTVQQSGQRRAVLALYYLGTGAAILLSSRAFRRGTYRWPTHDECIAIAKPTEKPRRASTWIGIGIGVTLLAMTASIIPCMIVIDVLVLIGTIIEAHQTGAVNVDPIVEIVLFSNGIVVMAGAFGRKGATGERHV